MARVHPARPRRQPGQVARRESATDVRLYGDEMPADADDSDAGHFSAAYMSALPYREANRSQSADRSDSVLKIEHRVVYPRVVAADEEAASHENEHRDGTARAPDDEDGPNGDP
jgi:hypothetical protein